VSVLSTLSFLLSKFLAAPEISPFTHISFSLFGWSILTFFSFLLVDLLFFLAYYSPFPARATILTEIAKNRRKAKIALTISTTMTIVGLISAAAAPVLVRTNVHLEKFPCELNGFTITQLSGMKRGRMNSEKRRKNNVIIYLVDTHLGNTFPRSKFVEIVNRVNELNPDMVVLTGDLIDAKISPELLPILEPLGWLKASYGIYYVTGNHEYLAGSATEWVAELANRKIHFLHNSNELISMFCIILF
jgi:Calcineurin-like phosphoesterase